MGSGSAASRAGFYAWLDARYTRLIEWSMAHRTAVMILAVVIGLASVPFYQGIGREFVPTDVDEAEFNISILAPEGASLASMRSAMDLAEHEIEAVRGVRDVLITTGGFAGSQVNSANVHVRIAPHEESIVLVLAAAARDVEAAARGGRSWGTTRSPR